MKTAIFSHSANGFLFVETKRLNGNDQIEYSENIWRPDTKFEGEKKVLLNLYWRKWILSKFNWILCKSVVFVLSRFLFIVRSSTCYMRVRVCASVRTCVNASAWVLSFVKQTWIKQKKKQKQKNKTKNALNSISGTSNQLIFCNQ